MYFYIAVIIIITITSHSTGHQQCVDTRLRQNFSADLNHNLSNNSILGSRYNPSISREEQ